MASQGRQEVEGVGLQRLGEGGVASQGRQEEEW